MDDGPPPRKKISRFFSGGKSLIGNLPGRTRKTTDDQSGLLTLPNDDAEASAKQEGSSFQDNQLLTGNAFSFAAATSNFSAPSGPQVIQETVTMQPVVVAPAASPLKVITARDGRRNAVYGSLNWRQAAANGSSATPSKPQNNHPFVFERPTNLLPHVSSQPVPLSRDQQPLVLQASPGPSLLGAQQPGLIQSPNLPQWQVPNSTPPIEPMNTAHGLGAMPASHPAQYHQDTGPLSAPMRAFPANIATTPLSRPIQQQHFLPRPPLPGPPSRPWDAGIDIDRDVRGQRLPTSQLRPIANILGHGITSLPLHATLTPSRRRPSSTPSTLYTSPDRIANAIVSSHKRKRVGLAHIPPPAYVYTRTNDPHFNIFAGILLYPELCFHLAATLPLRDLISLYAISRDFHTIIDTRFTTVILAQSLRKAPESSRTFPFRCYEHFCRRDPAARIPHPDPSQALAGTARRIPSFKWLAMVLYREKVVHELMTVFAEDGVPLPARCALAIKRMWFILDIPDNARRVGFIHNKDLFTDLDLYFGMCFLVKLDMRCNDPVAQEKRDGLRKMLLSQEGFDVMLKVLRGKLWGKKFEVMQAWIRYKYDILEDERGMDIFGVPAKLVGKLRMEYWGRATKKILQQRGQLQLLLRPDQLVMREAVKRGLRFSKHFLRSLCYGYVRMDTLENYAPRAYGRRAERLWDEYGVDAGVGGLTWTMRKLDLEGGEEGCDGDVLDLGERKQVSVFCQQGGEGMLPSREETRWKEEQKRFLEACMKWSKREREWAAVDVMTED